MSEKKLGKRLLTWVLVLVMMLSLLPIGILAADGEETLADPFEGAKRIYVSNNGTGDGTTEDSPMTLPAAVTYINGYTPEEGAAAPAFIISLTENLEFTCDSGALTLKKYATRILGNGHSIETNREITSTGEGTRVDLGIPDGTDTLTVNVNVSSSTTLAIDTNAKMYMYAGVTVHHTPEKNSGGAIQLNSGGKFYMYGGEVSNCVTANGAIYAQYGFIHIYGGKIYNNTATQGSGAIRLENSEGQKSTLVVDGDVLFENNTSESYGGAISLWRSTMTVTGATFTGNSASMGGAIFAIGSKRYTATAQLSNCTFTGNSTTGDGSGGALYLQDVETTLTDCTIENNTAGGGVFVSSYYSDQPLSKLTLNGINRIQNNTIAPGGTPCNLYLNIAGNTGNVSRPQLTVNVGNMSPGSRIGVSMDTVESAEEDKKPEESAPFTVDYKKDCGDTHPGSYFFSDNYGYRVDWSEGGNEARLLKGKAEYKVELDPTSLDFGSKVVDYATAPEAKTVTITNTGNMPVTVTLPTVDGYKFVWKDSGGNEPKTLLVGGSAVFTAQPKTGLPAGSHDKTIALIVDNGTAPELTVKFNVKNYTPYYPIQPEQPKVDIPDDDALGLNTTDHFAYIVGYGNGQVRPQNAITRAEVATIFFRLLTDDVREENFTSTNKYTDVAAGAWYNNAVSTLSAMGIITGYPDGTFRPNAYITRAEFAAIAARFDTDGDKTLAAFSDIANHWAKDEISVAYNNGWVDGYPGGTFGPQRNITRAETVTLVNRVLNRKPETEDDLLPDMTTWTDNADKKAWYYLAIQEATNSHYYEFKTNSEYEKWTELRETRDWTQLEK